MKSYELSFATVSIIKEDTVEVVIKEGVEMDEVMVDEYQDFLLSNLKAPFSIILNKKYPYCYNFKAQKAIAKFKDICAMAVIVGANDRLICAEMLISICENNTWDIKLFHSKDEALTWLDWRKC